MCTSHGYSSKKTSSSLVNRLSTKHSKSFSFRFWSSTTLSSIVPTDIKRITRTSCWLLRRWARWNACASACGFHQGSTMITILADAKLRPSPPHFKVSNSAQSHEQLLNFRMLFSRHFCVDSPEIIQTQFQNIYGLKKINKHETFSSIFFDKFHRLVYFRRREMF